VPGRSPGTRNQKTAPASEKLPEFQDFVIAHELLHLRVPNHGKLFKALLRVHVPDWKRHEIRRK
jgi:hypothetical protein